MTFEKRRDPGCVGETLEGDSRDDEGSLFGVDTGMLPARNDALADRFDFMSRALGVIA